jgi:hypothetical protein
VPAEDGAYAEPIDDENLVHALEHGHVIYWFNPGAPAQVKGDLKALGALHHHVVAIEGRHLDAAECAPAPRTEAAGAGRPGGLRHPAGGRPACENVQLVLEHCSRWAAGSQTETARINGCRAGSDAASGRPRPP